MANTINGDDGVISGSAGLKSTADATGILALQTNGTAAVTVDTSQNVGIGTGSPGYKLDVALSSSDVYSASGTTINTQQTSSVFIRNTSNTASTNFAAIYLNSRTSGAVAARIAVTGEHFVGDGSCLDFSTRGSANTAFTEHARFTAAGRLLVGLTSANTSGGVLQISNGITFPATQSASTDANTLDDYEEGSWTAAVVPASGSVTMGNSTCRYVKIGNVVTVNGYISISSVSSPSGQVTITGLPFSSNVSTAYWAGFSPADNLSTKNKAYLPSNSSTAFTYAQYNEAALGASLTNGWTMVISLSYIIA